MQDRDFLNRRDDIPATASWKTSLPQWQRPKEELEEISTTSIVGMNHSCLMTIDNHQNSMLGTEKCHNGHWTNLPVAKDLRALHSRKVGLSRDLRLRRVKRYSQRECRKLIQKVAHHRLQGLHPPQAQIHGQGPTAGEMKAEKTLMNNLVKTGSNERDPTMSNSTSIQHQTTMDKINGLASWDPRPTGRTSFQRLRVLILRTCTVPIWDGDNIWGGWRSMQLSPTTSWLKDSLIPRCSRRMIMNGWNCTTTSSPRPSWSDAKDTPSLRFWQCWP